MELFFDATAILESIADSFFVLDSGGRFAFVTRKAAELLGKSSAEILGKTFLDAFPEAVGSELYRSVEQSLLDQTPRRFDHFQPSLNRWFEQQTYINPDGGIAVFGRDITARRRLEEALRASEDRFRRLVDSNVIGIFVANGGLVTEANDLFLSLVGFGRDDLIRHQVRWHDITLPDQRPLDVAAERELRKERFCPPYERDFIKKDGTVVPVMIASTRVDRHPHNSDINSWEVLCVVHDLSRHKSAETRLRHLVEATKILGSSLDLQKTLHELARFLANNIGNHCVLYLNEGGKLYPAATASRVTGADPVVIEISHLPQMETVLTKGRSEVLDGVGLLVPLPSRGRIVGALFLGGTSGIVDYDDVHFLEEVGRRAGIALENTRLYKQSEIASRLKDEFVTALSHELRTPLTPILGGVYMLRTEPDDKRIFNKALDLIERNAKAQSKIVEDLLDVSRIISGNFRIRQESVEVETAIQEALEAVRPAREAKRIVIDVRLTPLNGIVYGDPDRLRQIFWNILSNAVKFTPNGGEISVELSRSGDQAEIRIADSGIGIAEKFLPFVFDRFSQEDTSRTRMHGGLGVGLAIVQHLVQSHGGTIHATSAGDGKGATFIVKLPLRAAASPDVRSRSASFTG